MHFSKLWNSGNIHGLIELKSCGSIYEANVLYWDYHFLIIGSKWTVNRKIILPNILCCWLLHYCRLHVEWYWNGTRELLLYNHHIFFELWKLMCNATDIPPDHEYVYHNISVSNIINNCRSHECRSEIGMHNFQW